MKRRKDWALRLNNELQYANSAYFITLTYDNDNIPLVYKNQSVYETLEKRHLQNYFKLLRNRGAKFSYFAVGEYGTLTKRPHYHILMFNYQLDSLYLYDDWRHGIVDIGSVESASIHYVTKDMMKENNKKQIGGVKGFFLMSKHLGLKGITKYKRNKLLNEKMIDNGGYKHRLPRYYSDKLFTDEQKLEQQKGINDMVLKLDADLHQRLIERGITNEVDRLRYIEKERRAIERQEYAKLKNSSKI